MSQVKLKVLICAATPLELRGWISDAVDVSRPVAVEFAGLEHVDISLMAMGVGVAPTVMRLTQYAARFDLVLNVGLAGAYSSELAIGQVVRVASDVFADYGIDQRGTFVPIHQSPMAAYAPQPMECPSPIPSHLPAVRAITLGMCSGSNELIERNIAQWNPDIETMEGAAVPFVCQQLGVQFVCLRAISNRVELRNVAAWNMDLALSNLHRETVGLLAELNQPL